MHNDYWISLNIQQVCRKYSVEGYDTIFPVVPLVYNNWLRCEIKNHQNSGIFSKE